MSSALRDVDPRGRVDLLVADGPGVDPPKEVDPRAVAQFDEEGFAAETTEGCASAFIGPDLVRLDAVRGSDRPDQSRSNVLRIEELHEVLHLPGTDVDEACPHEIVGDLAVLLVELLEPIHKALDEPDTGKKILIPVELKP